MESFASGARVPEISEDPLGDIPRVSELPGNHVAVETCRRRMIPVDRWDELRHADDFPSWANTLVPDRYRVGDEPEPRLVIPVIVGGKLVGFQGRSYGDSNAKYLTAALDRESPFLYGWDRVDLDRTIVAVEGPIDSMFIDNGVASAGGVITRELSRTGLGREHFTVAYDNEPRSESTIQKMEKTIELGYPILVWPERIRDKDINDMVLRLSSEGSYRAEDIDIMIRENTHVGLAASIALSEWKRRR